MGGQCSNTAALPAMSNVPVTMKACGLNTGKTPGGVELLEEFIMPVPEMQPRDILIKVAACGLNPVDIKKRETNMFGAGAGTLESPVVLGYDGAGTVAKVGSESSMFKIGDEVYFAGSIARNGSNAEYVAIDERIVGHAPTSVSLTKAAAQPLVLLTAWEGLFEGLGLTAGDPQIEGKTLLVLPGAGGVGSYVIQLASKLLGLKVIATASRPESIQASKDLGASVVINHREPLKEQLEKEGIDGIDFVFNAFDTSVYFDQYAEIVKPFGKIVSIVETEKKVNLTALMVKRISFAWELMFTRPLHGIDLEYQGHVLNQGAKLLDCGALKMPHVKVLPWSIENLQAAHVEQYAGKVVGKLVLTRQTDAAALTGRSGGA